jgi:hypothetical protein
MKGARVFLVGLGVSSCYWSKTPSVPYGQPELHWQTVAAGAPPLSRPRPLRSARLIVISRFRSMVTNPVGGLYDFHTQNESPLWRTYHGGDAAVPIFEGFADRLREAGLRALKDYTDHANVALMEPPLRRRDPLVVTATLLALRHDQVRERLGAEFEAAYASLEVSVRNVQEDRRLDTQRATVVLKVPAGGRNLLQLVGALVADEVAGREPFLRALQAEREKS